LEAVVGTSISGDRPLVSIIVPVYNHERYVSATLRSLIAQSYDNLELIVVNDGSSDNSSSVLHELAPDCRRRFSQYVQLDQPNAGAGLAFNRGVEAARGEFLFGIASDDLAEPNAIETLVPELLQDAQLGLVCGDADFIDADGTPISMPRNQKQFSSFVRLHIEDKVDFNLATDFGTYRSFIDWNYIPIGLLIRRSYFSQAGYYDAGLALEDWGAWLKLSKICRFKFIDRILCHYRLHDTNAHNSNPRRLQSDLIRLLIREARYCMDQGLESRWQSFIEQQFDSYRQHLDRELQQLTKKIAEVEGKRVEELEQYATKLAISEHLAAVRAAQISALQASTSWRITHPMRWLSKFIGRDAAS
jgi:glycosyltransferase involved in cell wall biosynthesis